MKFLILLGLVFSFNLQAEERYFCVAKRYTGNDVTQAINNCSLDKNFSEVECARNVSCRTYTTHCTAKRFAGDTPREAANRCVALGGYRADDCLRSVSCR